mmetsp:Transcript_4337/g.8661  ORF Transcript_4337/g.8661 Transcript_4337/m.8661 type:complete len:327 (-) Transcript_4337:63-1043(-)
MRSFFEAAFRPPPRSGSSREDSGDFAILPQQSDDELVLSEVHSKLDRVLNFLQHDVGYPLLHDARPQSGGGVQLQRPKSEEEAGGPAGHKVHPSQRVPKEEPQVADDEAQEVIRFSRNTAKFAHYPDDLVLVWRFAGILAEESPEAGDRVQNEACYRTVLLGIRLMHLCDYNYSDVVVTLAYTSVYFRSTFQAIGHKMSSTEAAHVCVLLMFLAHSYVLDETCPLRCWQKHIFKKYCTLKVLDAALFRLFQIRGFKLRISEADEKKALSVLLCAPSGLNLILSLDKGYNSQSRPPSASTAATEAGEQRDEIVRETIDQNGTLETPV